MGSDGNTSEFKVYKNIRIYDLLMMSVVKLKFRLYFKNAYNKMQGMKCLFRILMAILGCSFLDTSLGLASSKKVFEKEDKKVLRIGFFPNLTHMPALVAQAMTRQGNGLFERYLPQVKLEWRRFNAGPTAMENLVAGIVDVSYVGPSPALNLYNRTKGKDCRLLSGVVKGGSGLVLQKKFVPKDAKSWEGRRIATPQYGNTQDVACRAWFKKQGINSVALLPTSNPDQLTLFKKHQIDGVWTIEPWLSRLVNESDGKVYLTDDDSWTTILVGSVNFCENFGSLKSRLIQAHKELSLWIKTHPDEAAKLVQSEMKHQTSLDFPLERIKTTLERIKIETEVTVDSLQKWVDNACNIGFLKRENIVPLEGFMREFLKEKIVNPLENPEIKAEKLESVSENPSEDAKETVKLEAIEAGKNNATAIEKTEKPLKENQKSVEAVGKFTPAVR